MKRASIEGLVLKRMPMKDNDLLVSVLTRAGLKASIYSYGGQSSKKGKASLLDIGLMNRYEVSAKSRMMRLEEITSLWQHQNLRHDYDRFTMLCFVSELVELMALPFEFDADEQNGELFKIVSNFVFYLDSADKKSSWKCLFLFLISLMTVEGIAPDLDRCVLTGESLEGFACSLYPLEGGFALNDALSVKEGSVEQLTDDRKLRDLMSFYQQGAFKQLNSLPEVDFFELLKSLNFFCFQQHIELSHLKSFSLLKGLNR